MSETSHSHKASGDSYIAHEQYMYLASNTVYKCWQWVIRNGVYLFVGQ